MQTIKINNDEIMLEHNGNIYVYVTSERKVFLIDQRTGIAEEIFGSIKDRIISFYK